MRAPHRHGSPERTDRTHVAACATYRYVRTGQKRNTTKKKRKKMLMEVGGRKIKRKEIRSATPPNRRGGQSRRVHAQRDAGRVHARNSISIRRRRCRRRDCARPNPRDALITAHVLIRIVSRAGVRILLYARVVVVVYRVRRFVACVFEIFFNFPTIVHAKLSIDFFSLHLYRSDTLLKTL